MIRSTVATGTAQKPPGGAQSSQPCSPPAGCSPLRGEQAGGQPRSPCVALFTQVLLQYQLTQRHGVGHGGGINPFSLCSRGKGWVLTGAKVFLGKENFKRAAFLPCPQSPQCRSRKVSVGGMTAFSCHKKLWPSVLWQVAHSWWYKDVLIIASALVTY